MTEQQALEILQTRIAIAEQEGNPTEQSFLYALYKLLSEK